MATLNPLFGRLKGKYGGSVFYSNSGTQCMRERVLEVGNPKTSKQAIQRAILATVTQFTRAFAPVLNNCIETESGKSKNLAKVRSINMDIMRRLAAEALNGGFYTPKGSLVIAPNDYLISRGTLRGLSPIRDAVSRAALTNGALQFNDSDLVLSESVTASQMFPTITPGDQITILAAWLEEIEVGSYSGYCRFAFKDDVTPALVVESGSIYKLNEAAVDLTKAAGNWRALRFSVGTGARTNILVGGVFGSNPDETTDLAGLIVSRESQRMRSTAYMLSVDSFAGFTLDEVYPTYMAGGTPIDMPSEVYLNNDSQGTPSVVRYSGHAIGSSPELPYTFADASSRLIVLSNVSTVPDGTHSLGTLKYSFEGVDYEDTIEVSSIGSSVNCQITVGAGAVITLSGLNAQGPYLAISVTEALEGLTIQSIDLTLS